MAVSGRNVPIRGRLPESDIIQTHFVFLKDVLSSKPYDLLDALFAKKVFDTDDMEKIHKKEQDGRRAVAGAILNVLMGCGPGAYRLFLDCLKETNFPQALQKLEPEENAYITTSLSSAQKQPEPICFQLKNGLNVNICNVDLLDAHADVLVCSNYGRNAEGEITKRIKEGGGRGYAISLEELYKKEKKLSDWKVYQTLAGDLQFKCVYQAKVPPSISDGITAWLSNIKKLYSKILQNANKEKYVSITLPVIGADFARGSTEQCIEKAIYALLEHNGEYLTQVNIVLNDDSSLKKLRQTLSTSTAKDKGMLEMNNVVDEFIYVYANAVGTVIKMFEITVDNMSRYMLKKSRKHDNDWESSNATIPYPPHELPNGLIVHLRLDDVVDVHSCVIITTNYGKAENQGAVATRLREKGGVDYVKSLESLIRNNDGFEDWQVYSSNPGDLQFSEVYQAIIPPNPSADAIDDWLSNLHGLYVQILATADAQGYTSITLQVLDSEETQAQPETYLTVLLGALEEHVAGSLRDVYIVTRDELLFTLLMTTW